MRVTMQVHHLDEEAPLVKHEVGPGSPSSPKSDDDEDEGKQVDTLKKGSQYIYSHQEEVRAEYGDSAFKYKDVQKAWTPVVQAGPYATAFNLAKGMVGAGILALPQTFLWNGIGLAFVLMSLIIVMNYLSSRLLIKSADKACSITYEETALKALGRSGPVALDACIIVRNILASAAYLVIIRDSISGLLLSFGYTDKYLLIVVTVYMLLTVLPLSLLRNMNSLRFTSFASLFIMTFFAVGMVMHFVDVYDSKESFLWWKPSIDVFRSLPIQVFAVTSHHTYFAIRMETRDPSFKGFSVSLGWAMGYITVLYNVVGIVGYLSFLSATQGNIVLNYGTALIAALMKAAVCFNITCTYPLNLRPLSVAIDYILFHENVVKFLTFGMVVPHKDWVLDKEHAMKRNRIFSVLLFIVCYCIALSVADMSLLLGIAGSIAGSAMSFILPGLMNLYIKPNPSRKRWIASMSVVIFGSFVGITGIISTLYVSADK